MANEYLKPVLQNTKFFLVTWLVVIIVNQVFIFGACFAPYCLIAAIPHTAVIAGIITFFYMKGESEDKVDCPGDQVKLDKQSGLGVKRDRPKTTVSSDINSHEKLNIACPNCGSEMKLRTAKRGRYAGKQFLGCSQYPHCNGIVNIK